MWSRGWVRERTKEGVGARAEVIVGPAAGAEVEGLYAFLQDFELLDMVYPEPEEQCYSYSLGEVGLASTDRNYIYHNLI